MTVSVALSRNFTCNNVTVKLEFLCWDSHFDKIHIYVAKTLENCASLENWITEKYFIYSDVFYIWHFSGSSAQTLCPAGMYQPNTTQPQCVTCEPGNYCPGEGECISSTKRFMSLTDWPAGPTFPTFPSFSYFLIQSPTFPYFLRKQPYYPYFLGCHVVKLNEEHLKLVFLHWF